MILPITLKVAGLAAIINLWLAIRCGQARGKEGISIGDGGNDLMIRRMRAHANFIEYTPIVLILFGLVELAVGTSTWLYAVGIVYLLGRVAHGIGMDGNAKARGALVDALVAAPELASLYVAETENAAFSGQSMETSYTFLCEILRGTDEACLSCQEVDACACAFDQHLCVTHLAPCRFVCCAKTRAV